MAFHHRKININPYDNTQTVRLDEAPRTPKPCDPKNSDDCFRTAYPPFPPLPPPRPPPPPPPPNDGDQFNQRHQMSSILILMFCIFGATVGVFCYLAIVKCYKNWSNSRRRNPPTPPIFDDVNEDFIDANLGPALDHPIWYINTIGLQQSVINSITIFMYKRDEGLIEGTECSVCLNEFQEDESLRLLPKCSHAFHVPCIDTWLRSHKNCPLCRAPIVTDSNNAHLSIAESNLSDLGSNEETLVENLENYGGLGSHRVGEDGSSEMRIGAASLEEETIAEISEKNSRYFSARNSDSRVRSDLADHRLKVEEELQPRRRSVSMDSSSASAIYRAMANVPPVENEGCSDSQLVQVKKPNREMVAKRAKRNSSIYRMVMKSSSFRRCLQKEPVSMKRSFSSSGNLSLPKYSRSQDSILPL